MFHMKISKHRTCKIVKVKFCLLWFDQLSNFDTKNAKMYPFGMEADHHCPCFLGEIPPPSSQSWLSALARSSQKCPVQHGFKGDPAMDVGETEELPQAHLGLNEMGDKQVRSESDHRSVCYPKGQMVRNPPLWNCCRRVLGTRLLSNTFQRFCWGVMG